MGVKHFTYWLIIAFIFIAAILTIMGVLNIIGSAFRCTFTSSEIDNINIDAKLKDQIFYTLKIPTCFEWIQAPCKVNKDKINEMKIKIEGEGEVLCGLVKGEKVLKCYNFDVYWNSNGTTLPGEYQVKVGRNQAIFQKECSNGPSVDICGYPSC